MVPVLTRLRAALMAGLFASLAASAAAYAEPRAPGQAPDGASASDSEIIRTFIAKADALIHDNNLDVKTTAHYRVKTDDPRFDILAAANLLESFRGFFDSFWQGRAELQPYDDLSRVYLFYSRAKFKQLGVYEERPDDIAMVGHYQRFFDVVALHTDSVRPEEFPDFLVHEAAHQLVGRRLYGVGATPAIWLSEGLACYFGNTLRDGSGAFQPGRIGGKDAVFFKGQSRSAGRLGWAQARAYRKTLASGDALLLDTVLRTESPEVFYDARAQERYSASWLLVHYLVHADGGAHVAPFVAYLKHDAAGAGGADVLYGDLGMTPEQVSAGFRAYVAELKP